ncbi:glycine dehydrogenase subunit 2 [Desulfitispora alkaliphila]|uniref:aminomethyl-transferring glycine dehydrogenase subunit GcvPB n=1 Tax=Desulfitispora alkaliphila TaxID=622674 RepID=UPI003D1DE986
MSQIIFELSKPGRKAYSLPELDVPDQRIEDLLPGNEIRKEPAQFPEVSELDVVRHFTRLSKKNYGVDDGFYPLGSCTMKYNPKVNEDVSRLPGFALSHPYQPEELSQGSMQIIYELDKYLSEISGMSRVSLQPAAGAHGELAGLMIIKKYHEELGEHRRNKVIVPDSAHGTNPATATVCGYETVEVKSNPRGGVDLEELKKAVGEDTAALMLTNPNTLGLFDENIEEIANIVHEAGGLLYYDGANMNPILGVVRPGDMGFDVIHYNLHKTFSTPHGGGGPGAGPVGVRDFLVPYLPKPMIEYNEEEDRYYMDYDLPKSIGKVKSYYGNFGVAIKAYSYIRALGAEGIKSVAEHAVLNANYLMRELAEAYHLPFDQTCMHEFIITPKPFKDKGVRTIDIAKRLLDYGYHPPTIYFPLIIEEAMMFEPTETESKETLDSFIEAMKQIAKECVEKPEIVINAPHETEIKRLDEVTAARKPDLRWQG